MKKLIKSVSVLLALLLLASVLSIGAFAEGPGGASVSARVSEPAEPSYSGGQTKSVRPQSRIKVSLYGDEGWYYYGQDWYYFTDGMPLTDSWLCLSGYYYAFDSSGRMITDWADIDGEQYYFYSDGSMATGWARIEGDWFYFGSDGATRELWQYIDGSWYYFVSRDMVPGSSYVYGHMFTDCVIPDHNTGRPYILCSDGHMARSEFVLDGDGFWYYAGESGVLETGWVYYGGSWYFMEPRESGDFPYMSMYYGCKAEINGQLYYFGESGNVYECGWFTDDEGHWLYANSGGALSTGWQWIGGSCYYFYPSTGIMAADTYVGSYWVNSAGQWT